MTTPEPTEYELRVQSLDLASRYRDNTHDTLKRAREYAAYLRDGVDADRATAEAEQRAKPIVERRCDACLSSTHPHTFVRCPNDGCECTEAGTL